MNDYWENFREYKGSKEERLARRFRSYVKTLENPRGRIARMPCVYCGEENAQAHHPDYDYWYMVVWACSSCHRKVERGLLKITKRTLFDYSSLILPITKKGLQREGPVKQRSNIGDLDEPPF